MDLFRPHIAKWTTSEQSGTDPITGYPVVLPGVDMEVPCRFVAGGKLVFKNEDSTETSQKGRIRVDIGSDLPLEGQSITVVNAEDPTIVHFTGTARVVYAGGTIKSWRIDV